MRNHIYIYIKLKFWIKMECWIKNRCLIFLAHSIFHMILSNMLVIFPCVSMKGERFLRATDHAKNLFSIVYERVAQRAITRFGMTFLGNSFSTMEISGPSPLGQANLDAVHAPRSCVCSRHARFTRASKAHHRNGQWRWGNIRDPLKQSSNTQPGINRELWISQRAFLLDS